MQSSAAGVLVYPLWIQLGSGSTVGTRGPAGTDATCEGQSSNTVPPTPQVFRLVWSARGFPVSFFALRATAVFLTIRLKTTRASAVSLSGDAAAVGTDSLIGALWRQRRLCPCVRCDRRRLVSWCIHCGSSSDEDPPWARVARPVQMPLARAILKYRAADQTSVLGLSGRHGVSLCRFLTSELLLSS